MAYAISVYITNSIAPNDNYTVGGASTYFMRAEKDEKLVMEKTSRYRDDTVKRNDLYIYGIRDALMLIRLKVSALDIFVDDKRIVLNAERMRQSDYINKNGKPMANAAAWEKLADRIMEINPNACRFSYMSFEDMEKEARFDIAEN